MAKISKKKRSMKIKIKLRKQSKLAKLRRKYAEAKYSQEKEKILEKVFRLTPWLSKNEFLTPLDKGKTKDQDREIPQK